MLTAGRHIHGQIKRASGHVRTLPATLFQDIQRGIPPLVVLSTHVFYCTVAFSKGYGGGELVKRGGTRHQGFLDFGQLGG